MHENSVSLIIPTRNRWEELNRFFISLKKLILLPDEIIVLDDNSIQHMPDDLKSAFPGIKYIRFDRHIGTPLAKNIGIKQAAGNYLWFTDDDVEILTGKHLENALNLLKANPGAGGIGGEFCFTNESKYLRLQYLYANGDTRDEYIEDGKPGKLYEIDLLSTCNFICSRSLMIKMGGFNPEIHVGEDKEISCKFRKHGYLLLNASDCALYHYQSEKMRPCNVYRLFLKNQLSLLYFVLEHWNIFYLSIFPMLDIISKYKRLKHQVGLNARDPGLPYGASSESSIEYKTNPAKRLYMSFACLFLLFVSYILALSYIPKAFRYRFGNSDHLS